jgi:ribosomal protein L40E
MRISGKPVVCSHCNGVRFSHRKAQLNTALMTFFNLDFLNSSADIFVCETCGHLKWFLDSTLSDDPEEIALESDTAQEAVACVSCGEIIPPGEEKCRKCGWTYR